MLKVTTVEFVKSAVRPAQYPPVSGPEIAFAGRSNVGKSSLINALLGRKKLVRTSATPGRTQLLNFFSVNGSFCLVDLPGYGFAKVPLAVKKHWAPMVRTYLEQRESLRAVVLILDIRRTPSDEDLNMLDWLESCAVPTIPVLTKLDKIRPAQLPGQLAQVAEVTGLPRDAFSLFSAVTRVGREDIWERIEEVLDG